MGVTLPTVAMSSYQGDTHHPADVEVEDGLAPSTLSPTG
jgi:hypothetical protein